MGVSRPYIIKDIYKLASDIVNENMISYGKELQFKHTVLQFEPQSRPMPEYRSSSQSWHKKISVIRQ